MDAANVDLKAFTEEFYQKICHGHLEPVLETLVYLKHETDVWFEITTLLIPGENDSDDEIDAMTRWIAGRAGPGRAAPLHRLPSRLPDARPPPDAARDAARAARQIALAHGLRYVYTGNVHDEPGGSTCCPGCGALLIGRDWYEITAWNLESHLARRLRRLRHADPGPVRGAPRKLGRAAATGAALDLRGACLAERGPRGIFRGLYAGPVPAI